MTGNATRNKDEATMSKGSMAVKNTMKKIIRVSVCKTLWKMGREDPRRVIHGLKAGTAMTLVSFLFS